MSTGVNFSEQDQSSLIPLRPGGFTAVAGPCAKGPIGEYKDIISSEEFRRVYGGDYLLSKFGRYCIQNLDNGAKLRISRVAHATDPNDIATLTAVKSTVTLLDRAGAVASPAVLQSTIAGPWFIPDGTTFTVEVTAVDEALKTVNVLPAISLTATDETAPWDFTGGKTLDVKVGGTSQPTQILSLPTSKFAVPATATAAEVAQAINDEAPVGMTAIVTGAGPNFTVSLLSDQKGTGAKIQVTGGSANAELAFPTTEQVGSGDFIDHRAVTPAELATYLQGANHGVTYNNSSDATSVSITTVATGVAATLRYDTPSTGAAILGLPVGGALETGSAATTALNTLRFDALSEGVHADGISFDILAATDGASDHFNILIPVQTGVARAEFYENLTMVPTDARYVVGYVNRRSSIGNFTDLNSATTAPNDLPALGNFSFAGGNDGMTGLVGNDFLGGAASKLGVNAFNGGGDVMDLMTPTIHLDSASGVPVAMVSIKQYAENRRDMIYHGITPNPDQEADSIAFRNGDAPYSHQKFDSSYMSVGFGTGSLNLSTGVEYFNMQAQLPSVLSYNDTGNGRQSEGVGPWYAPAGDKRGRTKFQKIVPQISAEAQNDPTKAALEAAQMNYLATFGSRVLIWNQATTQVQISALSDINVRRAMIFFEQSIVKAILQETFEPNDPIFFRSVYRRINTFLARVQGQRGLLDYAIFCDQDVDQIKDVQVNTVQGIDEGVFVCKIFISPSRAAKDLQLLFTVTGAGVDFAEIFDTV